MEEVKRMKESNSLHLDDEEMMYDDESYLFGQFSSVTLSYDGE